MAQYTHTSAGVPVRQVTSHESFLNIHPDHTGLIIGRGGSTIRKIQKDTGVDVLRIRKPNQMSGGMPWIQIRGHIKSVESAYQRVLTIAQEADRRIPRMGQRNMMAVPPAPTHPAPTFQHPFGSNSSQKPRPPPLQMPQPEAVEQHLGFAASDNVYQPHSPAYCPHSPEYAPLSPSYRPLSPRSPRTPPLEPKSPELPPAQENAPKKLKFKRRTASEPASVANTESS